MDPKEERQRIVKAAATILREDIRSQVYETSHYLPSDSFLQEVETVIPENLQVLLQEIILKGKRGCLNKWKTKCTAIAHAIISAARPRSFLSGLQIGLAAFIYKKFRSRKLLEVLCSLGFCASYEEVGLFEASSIMGPGPTIQPNAFSQFVFDNADFNTNTLDGLRTFHAMGGMVLNDSDDENQEDNAIQLEETDNGEHNFEEDEMEDADVAIPGPSTEFCQRNKEGREEEEEQN